MNGKLILISLMSCVFFASSVMAAPATKEEIAELYRSVLGREQDEEGAASWKKSGLSIEEIKKGFLESDEYKKKLAAKARGEKPATKEEIAELYRSVLGREQDEEGAASWKKSGLSIQEIKKGFLASDEYKNKLASKARGEKPATDEEIAQLYRSVLKREQDEEGAAYWKKSGLSIQGIKKGFLASDEYKSLMKDKKDNKETKKKKKKKKIVKAT